MTDDAMNDYDAPAFRYVHLYWSKPVPYTAPVFTRLEPPLPRPTPIATLATRRLEDGGLLVAAALCSRRDAFSKRKGCFIAQGRLLASLHAPHGRHVIVLRDGPDGTAVEQLRRFAADVRRKCRYADARSLIAARFGFDGHAA